MLINKAMQYIVCSVFLALAVGGPCAGFAGNIFTVVSGNDWNAVANWSEGVPAAGQNVVVASGRAGDGCVPKYTSIAEHDNSTIENACQRPRALRGCA